MGRAKQVVGAHQCIGGNVPGSMLAMGTPAQVDAYVKDLLAKTATNGGFLLGTGIVLDDADPACYKAFIDAGRKYGADV
jgi:uroporphyrinogen-III decarboxylase